MSVKTIFGGKQVFEPGSYGRITSGIPPRDANVTSGKCVIIDTGLGSGWGGGGAITATYDSGNKAFYEFDGPDDFKKFMGGGIYADLSKYLFKPSKRAGGAQSIIYVKAATDVAGTVTLTFNGGALTLRSKVCGTAGNAFLKTISSEIFLVKGVAVRLVVSPSDSAKFVLEFFRGGYRGVDNCYDTYGTYSSATTYGAGTRVMLQGLLFESVQGSNINHAPLTDTSETWWSLVRSGATFLDNVSDPVFVTPTRLFTSPDVTLVSELRSWIQTNDFAKALFEVTASSISTDTIVSGDLATLGVYKGVTGGTTDYSVGTDFESVLEVMTELDYTFILSGDYGSAAPTSVKNDLIVEHIREVSEFTRFLFVGGGNGSGSFVSQSIGAATHYNDQLVTVVHGDVDIPKKGGTNRRCHALYAAALALGRVAGLPPQMPATWKDVLMSCSSHVLSASERKRALDAGVLHFRQTDGEWVINQAVNTLGKNENLFNDDPEASSAEISIERIKAQLNKILVIGSRNVRDKDGNRTFIGGNRGTASAQDIKTWTEGQLGKNCATTLEDGLIITFQNVTVQATPDGWDTRYGFVVNGPVNKLFMTGAMLDSSVTP